MKKFKYVFSILTIFIISCLGLNISVYASENTGIKFNIESTIIQYGTTTTAVKLLIFESDVTLDDINFTSAKPEYVTIDSNGKITGIKNGTSFIYARTKDGRFGTYCLIVVQSRPVRTTKITLPQKSVTLKKGEKFTLSPQLDPITSQDAVTYTSSDKKIATVSKKGVITAKKAGTAKITVKAGNKKATFTVKVAKTRAEQITNVPASKKLKKGKSLTLKPKTVPAKTDDTITYKSSNKKVATVSNKGKVVAKKKGKATITVKCGKVSVKCKITVK